jgi:ribosomal protein S18
MFGSFMHFISQIVYGTNINFFGLCFFVFKFLNIYNNNMTLQYSPYTNTNKTSNEDCPLLRGVCKYYKLKAPIDTKKPYRQYGKIVETGVFGGSKSKSKSNYTEEQKSYVENVNKNITENFMSNMTSIVQKNCVDISNENQQSMMNEIKAANVLSVSGTKGKSFKLSAVNQENETEVQSSMSSENKATTKIKTQASTKTSNQLTDFMKDSTKMGESLTGVLNNGIDAVAGVANNAVDTVGDVANTSINAAADVATAGINALTGSNSSTVTNTDIKIDDTVINHAIEKATSEIKLEENIENAMENHISTESLQECGNKIAGTNEIKLENLEFEEEIEITDINQKNMIKAIIDCQFSNEVCNEIVTDFVNELTSQLEKSSLTEEEQEGFGQALAAAAEGVGEGLATTAEGVGEGVGTAAEGVGEGIGSVFEGLSSMTWIFIACCCLLVVGVIAFVGMGGIEKTASAAKNFKR